MVPEQHALKVENDRYCLWLMSTVGGRMVVRAWWWNVHENKQNDSNIIHSSPKVETTQMTTPLLNLRNKLWYIHTMK